MIISCNELGSAWSNLKMKAYENSLVSALLFTNHLDSLLEKYNAKYYYGLKIEFETEEDYIRFVLEWT